MKRNDILQVNNICVFRHGLHHLQSMKIGLKTEMFSEYGLRFWLRLILIADAGERGRVLHYRVKRWVIIEACLRKL